MPAGPGSVLARTVFERKPVQIPDVLADPDYQLERGDAPGRLPRTWACR